MDLVAGNDILVGRTIHKERGDCLTWKNGQTTCAHGLDLEPLLDFFGRSRVALERLLNLTMCCSMFPKK